MRRIIDTSFISQEWTYQSCYQSSLGRMQKFRNVAEIADDGKQSWC
jgi:hypothetical protein